VAKKKKKTDKPKGVRITNRKARHDYHITEVVECGIALTGTEVKSLRAGQARITESFARIRNGEVYLVGANIALYPQAAPGMQHNTTRDRKLLLRKRQIAKLQVHLNQKGKTLIPLAIYFSRGWAKCELGIAEGKRQYDKRQDLRRKDHNREMQRATRRR